MTTGAKRDSFGELLEGLREIIREQEELEARVRRKGDPSDPEHESHLASLVHTGKLLREQLRHLEAIRQREAQRGDA